MNLTYAWCGASHEDQTAQVGSALVTQSTSGVDQSTNAVGLNRATDEGGTPCGGGSGGLLGL